MVVCYNYGKKGHLSTVCKTKAEFFFSIKKSCPERFSNIHRKTPALESFFNKVIGLQTSCITEKRLQDRCFTVNIVIFLRKPVLKNIGGRLLLVKQNPQKKKKKNSNLDQQFKSNVFQNSENPNLDESLSENKPFTLCKKKINDKPQFLYKMCMCK